MIVGLVISIALIALLLVFAWKYWHGEWLRSIAGNNFATDEELRGPDQLKLGKRTAVVCLVCAVAVIMLLGITIAAQAVFGIESPTADAIILVAAIVAGAVIGVACIGLCVIQWREGRAKQLAERAGDPTLEQERRLDARQAVVLIGIVVVLEVAVPLIAFAVSS